MKFREKKAFLSKTVNRLPERSPIPDSGYSNKEAFSLEKHPRPLFPLLLLQQLTDRFLEDLVIAGAENTFTLHPITGGLTDHKGGGYP